MHVRLLLTWAAFGLGSLFSHAGWAASYFVDSVAGSDSNSGLSESAPWRTIQKVNISSFPFGSTIFLKRGSLWHEQLDVPSSGLTIDAYGSGPLPTFDGSEPIADFRLAGRGIYSRDIPIGRPGADGGLGNITENGVFMRHVDWLGTVAKTLSTAPVGSFTFQFPSNRLYIKPATPPAGNSYRVSTILMGVQADGKTDITVQNVNIRRTSVFGIRFANCMRCTARNSTISDLGGAIVFPFSIPYLYTGNGVEYSGVSEDGLVEGMTISNMYDSGLTPQTYAANSRLSRITFRNSTIERCGFAGVEISALPTGKPSVLSDITVSGLTIRDTGRGWSGNRYGNTAHGILVQANEDWGTLTGAVIENTGVSNSVGDGVRISGESGTVALSRLILTGNNYGINVSNRARSAFSMKLLLSSSLILGNRNYGLIYDSIDAQGFSVFHNTFYDNRVVNFAIGGQKGQAQIQNNIFASSASMTHLFLISAQTLPGASVNQNCYVNGRDMIRFGNAVYASLPPFKAATGFENKGVGTGNVRFVNPAAFDFRLQSSSPCVKKGSPRTGVATDLMGRRFKNPPSMGALQR